MFAMSLLVEFFKASAMVTPAPDMAKPVLSQAVKVLSRARKDLFWTRDVLFFKYITFFHKSPYNDLTSLKPVLQIDESGEVEFLLAILYLLQ